MDNKSDDESLARLKESMLEAQVEAALGGHDLAEWEQTGNGYQAICRLCQSTTWVKMNGLRYSLLANTCPGIQ